MKIFRDRRILLPIIALSMVAGLCGLLSGWGVLLRCIIFLLAALFPLVLGSLWIYQNFWWRPGWGIVLMAILIGLVGFEIALLGVALNFDVREAGWGRKIGEAAIVGSLGFLATLTFGPLILLIARFFRT